MFKRGIPSKKEPLISILIGVFLFGIAFLFVTIFSDKTDYANGDGPKSVQESKNAVKQKEENGLNIITYKAENIQVSDGDTLKAINGDKEISVRLLYVDTPESVHPNKTEQPYGVKASEFTKGIIEQSEEVEFITTGIDNYDRVLALVKVDGVSLQKILLTNGFARIAYVDIDEPSENDETNIYKKEQLALFKKDEAKAKNEKLRIWSNKNYVTNKGFNDFLQIDEIKNP